MIAIISDIHGNYPALVAVLSKIDTMGINKIICLGDTAGYYSQINECCEELQKRKIFSLMGNHDWYMTANAPCPRSNSANDCLDYQRKVIKQENMNWLSSLKPQASLEGIQIAHGGWNDPLDEYLRPSEKYFSNLNGRVFASGHTHVPVIWTGNGISYCNPGAVGQPRDGNKDASFAIWDGQKFTNVRTPYEIEKTQAAMSEAGFDEYFYSNLYIGARIGGKIDIANAADHKNHDK